MTLRRKLVALQVAVVLVGLTVFGAASYLLYQRSQYHDRQATMRSEVGPLDSDLCQAAGLCPGRVATTTCGPAPDLAFDPGTYAELLSATGKRLSSLEVPFPDTDSGGVRCPDPRLPADIHPGFVQVASASSAPGPFLVLATPAGAGAGQPGPAGLSGQAPHGPAAGQQGGGLAGSAALAGDVVVLASPIGNITSSLGRLLALDLGLGGSLVLLLAAITLLFVRASLQPLDRMVDTAGAIGRGDLSRRVPGGDPRSETGQLGHALNHMLSNIEGAFAARDATERRLRQFLADASHELRTPLTSIRGYAELWRLAGGATGNGHDGGEPSALDAATAMDRIEHHAQRMSELVDELLLLARLDEARPPDRAPVDLVVLASEACDDAVALDPSRPVRLDAPAPVLVEGDAGHLRRAVANLTTNAVSHTPEGSPIEVSVRAEGGAAEVVVRDHGGGLPAEGLAHAFDRFWQADSSRGGGGTGLGLAIVAAIAAEHGGRAAVTNAPDGGAEFTLRLPLPRPASPPMEATVR